jgi:hypothetical protein
MRHQAIELRGRERRQKAIAEAWGTVGHAGSLTARRAAVSPVDIHRSSLGSWNGRRERM